MAEGALPLGVGKVGQQVHPAGMEGFQQLQGGRYRQGSRIVQLGPLVLGVGLNQRIFFGQGELEAGLSGT